MCMCMAQVDRERDRERVRERERWGDRNVLSTFATDSYRKMTVEWTTKTINGSDASLTNVSMYHLYLCIFVSMTVYIASCPLCLSLCLPKSKLYFDTQQQWIKLAISCHKSTQSTQLFTLMIAAHATQTKTQATDTDTFTHIDSYMYFIGFFLSLSLCFNFFFYFIFFLG